MAQPRSLKNPPIVEAVIDLRASISGSPEDFKNLADELVDEFPHVEIKQTVKGKVEFKDDQPIASLTAPPSFAGIWMANEGKSIYLRLDTEGLALINVNNYIGGNQLIDEALKRWEWLVRRKHPKSVSCVAMNYLNRLEIPLKQGEDIEQYFEAPPTPPKGAPQLVSEYLSRIVSRDDKRNATATIIQQFKPHHTWDTPFPIKIVVEVSRSGQFSVDAPALQDILGSLRGLKNEVFFSLLTEKTVEIYE